MFAWTMRTIQAISTAEITMSSDADRRLHGSTPPRARRRIVSIRLARHDARSIAGHERPSRTPREPRRAASAAEDVHEVSERSARHRSRPGPGRGCRWSRPSPRRWAARKRAVGQGRERGPVEAARLWIVDGPEAGGRQHVQVDVVPPRPERRGAPSCRCPAARPRPGRIAPGRITSTTPSIDWTPASASSAWSRAPITTTRRGSSRGNAATERFGQSVDAPAPARSRAPCPRPHRSSTRRAATHLRGRRRTAGRHRRTAGAARHPSRIGQSPPRTSGNRPSRTIASTSSRTAPIIVVSADGAITRDAAIATREPSARARVAPIAERPCRALGVPRPVRPRGAPPAHEPRHRSCRRS